MKQLIRGQKDILKRKPASSRHETVILVSSSESQSEDDEIFEVEEIQDYRAKGAKKEYLIKWKGYDVSDNTWEDESNEVVNEFWARRAAEIETKKQCAAETVNRRTNNSYDLNIKKKVNRDTSRDVEKLRDLEHLHGIGRTTKTTRLHSRPKSRVSLAAFDPYTKVEPKIEPVAKPSTNQLVIFTSDDEHVAKPTAKRKISTDLESESSVASLHTPPKLKNITSSPSMFKRFNTAPDKGPIILTTQSYILSRDNRIKESKRKSVSFETDMSEMKQSFPAKKRRKPVAEKLIPPPSILLSKIQPATKSPRRVREVIISADSPEKIKKEWLSRQIDELNGDGDDDDYVRETQFSSPTAPCIKPKKTKSTPDKINRQDGSKVVAPPADISLSQYASKHSILPIVPEKSTVVLTQSVLSPRTFSKEVAFNMHSPSSVSQTVPAWVQPRSQSRDSTDPILFHKSCDSGSTRGSISMRPLFEDEDFATSRSQTASPTYLSSVATTLSSVFAHAASTVSSESCDSEYLSDTPLPLQQGKKSRSTRYEPGSTLSYAVLALNSWTHLIASIDTVKRVSPDKIQVYVSWKSGAKTIHDSLKIHECAGLLLMRYYESLIE